MAVIGLSAGATPGALQRTGHGPTALATLHQGKGPIVIMLHGYKYLPGNPKHCPHSSLFDAEADWAWPAQLGLHQEGATAIAFGWNARGPLARVFLRAGALGSDLADTITRIQQLTPHRPIHVIAHSMGAEVALSGLSQLPTKTVQRMILLTGAAFRSRAEAALQSPAGRTVELINITSRENDFFDFALECLVRAPRRGDRVLGAGISAPNAVTLQLDCTKTLKALARLGYGIHAPGRRICHWSSYTRPGVMAFYAACLSDKHGPSLAQLRRASPEQTAPRWARLSLGTALKTRMMAPSTAGDLQHERHAN